MTDYFQIEMIKLDMTLKNDLILRYQQKQNTMDIKTEMGGGAKLEITNLKENEVDRVEFMVYGDNF